MQKAAVEKPRARAPGEKEPDAAQGELLSSCFPRAITSTDLRLRSLVSTAAETSSISDPEEEETRATGNQGKKAT